MTEILTIVGGVFLPTNIMNQNITHPQLVKALLKPGKDILKTLTPNDVDILNCSACICGEAGELFDAIKKRVFYRQELNRANVVEELGDLEFYMEGLREAIGITREETLAGNIDKLSGRYKKLTYSDADATARADKETVAVTPGVPGAQYSSKLTNDHPAAAHALQADVPLA